MDNRSYKLNQTCERQWISAVPSHFFKNCRHNNNFNINNWRHLRQNNRRICTWILTAVIIICCFIILWNKSISSASTEPHKDIYFMSVEIQQGDSLWSIADEYFTDDWKDMNTYIEEIKEFNGLESSRIQAGNYLSIPYIVEAADENN